MSYELDDIITLYFVVKKDKDRDINFIQAWSKDKKLVNFYMEFHHCKNFHLKKVTGRVKDIRCYINENIYDEIGIYHISVINKDKLKTMYIPATETEISFIREEEDTFFGSRINYSYINSVIPYLKDKYKRALKDILLIDIIMTQVNNRSSTNIIQSIEFDELKLLFRYFNDNFGE